MINKHKVYHMEGHFLYNQLETILEKYEIEIKGIAKGRGTHICDTDKGMLLLAPYRGFADRGAFLQDYLRRIKEKGFQVEQIYNNKEGSAVTVDELTGDKFILKDYINGKELDTGNLFDMRSGAKLLASYHRVAAELSLELETKEFSMVEGRKRHYCELIKTRNYIRGNKKNEFERTFMSYCEDMIHRAKESVDLLKEEEPKNKGAIWCHGDCNQHNILLGKEQWYLVNFDGIVYQKQMEDVAFFLRKMLEKNEWDEAIGTLLLSEYEKNYPLSKQERKQLYALLLFPEKFWKITNHYMNSRKSWISQRDIEKMKTVIKQEENRMKFLEKLFSFTS